MAKGRFVSKQIACCEQLERVSLEAALLFTWCIPHLDVNGRLKGHPSLIKSQVCPLRPEITTDMVPDLLRTLARERLVRWYEVQGQQIVEYPTFRVHQHGLRPDKEGKPTLPGWEEGAIDLAQTDQLPLRSYSGPTPDLRPPNRSEENGREGTDAYASGQEPGIGPTGQETAPSVNRHALLAPVIRECLWLGSKPPEEGWSMGRCLDICDGLMTTQEIDAPELCQIIRVIRPALSLDDKPRTMRIVAGKFVSNFHEARSYYLKTLGRDAQVAA